jgi:urease accessory protein
VSPAEGHAPWCAHLDLQFAADAGRTVLVRRSHSGPLQVQKALYPEGSRTCHVAVLHPPGGIAGGDALTISAGLRGDSHAVLTTPGATKWYRSIAGRASQRLAFSVGEGGILEWLPRENILFNDSHVAMGLGLDLAAGARFLGWEILCFGRRASGESWRQGSLRLDTQVRLDGALLWGEQADIAAGSGFAASMTGLAGCSVGATFIAAGFAAQPYLLQACRELSVARQPRDLEESARLGLTWVPGVLIARYLGDSSEDAFDWFTSLWSLLRPALLGVAPVRPRLWAC